MELMSPSGNFLYKQTKKQYDSYDFKTVEAGEYKFCFSNEFSTFTHKVVYFDFMVGDEDEDFLDIEEGGPTAMTQVILVKLVYFLTGQINTLVGSSF